MSDDLSRLVTRTRESLAELDILLLRIGEGWQRSLSTGDDFYLDGVALNLHGFYSGLERIFELVAEQIDGQKPTGDNWHQVLLKQMTDEVPGVRPAVISGDTFRKLNEYRGFRHVVRIHFSPHPTHNKLNDLFVGNTQENELSSATH